MAETENEKVVVPIIIKKVKKGVAHGSHGGSWKIAYADFVTAMMAFFMLMWLINVTSEEQRKGIADYFAPNIINMKSRNGASGMMGGINVSNPNNSNGKGTDPSPVEKPEEVILEDVSADVSASESKRISKSPDMQQKSGTSDTSVAEDNKTQVAPQFQQTMPSQDSSQTAKSESTSANPMPSESNVSQTSKNNAPSPAMDHKNETAAHESTLMPKDKLTQKGQDSGQNSTVNKSSGTNVSKGEAKSLGASRLDDADKGTQKPSLEQAIQASSQNKDVSKGENVSFGQSQQAKSQEVQGRHDKNAASIGSQNPSQSLNGKSVAEAEESMNGTKQDHGTEDSIASQQAFASPKGAKKPSSIPKSENQVSVGKQQSLGKNTVHSNKENQAESDGIMKPSYTTPGQMIAKGHEVAQVKIQTESKTQSTENVSNQQKVPNIQDAESKMRNSGQNGGRKSVKEIENKIQMVQKDGLEELAQSQTLEHAIQTEKKKSEARRAKLSYNRSIQYASSAKAKTQQKELTQAKEQAKSSDVAKQALKFLQDNEDKQLRSAMAEIMATISKNPELKGLMPHLVAEVRPEGLRIQLIDQDKISMFPSGSAELLPQTKKLLQIVAKLIGPLTNQLVISGHTDSRPYINPTRYSNWELSADRANATRRALISNGVPEDRFESVMGKEATEPFLPEDPAAASNRRISITLLRQHGVPESDALYKLTDPTQEHTIEKAEKMIAQTPDHPMKGTIPPSTTVKENKTSIVSNVNVIESK